MQMLMIAPPFSPFPPCRWLPNNLGATLEYMQETCGVIDWHEASGRALPTADREQYLQTKDELEKKISALRSEVNALQDDFHDAEADEFTKRERTVSA